MWVKIIDVNPDITPQIFHAPRDMSTQFFVSSIMQRTTTSLMIVLLWTLLFVTTPCAKRNLYFADYYYKFNTSNSQIIGVFSSDCNLLKGFLTNTPVIVSNLDNIDINYTQSIVDHCIQVTNPLYSAITNSTLNYDVFQHFVYYTLTESELQAGDYYGNLTFNLVNDTSSLVYHLLLYNVSKYTGLHDSLQILVNELSCCTSVFNYKNVNNSQMVGYESEISDRGNDGNNSIYAQVLVSNSITFLTDERKDSIDSFMYDQCGASIRLNMEWIDSNGFVLIQENQTALITYSSDVIGLSNQEIVKCFTCYVATLHHARFFELFTYLI